MLEEKINAFLDSELKLKLESLVINSMPQRIFQSDFQMLNIANPDTEEVDGVRMQVAIKSEDTFFISMVNDFGIIDYSFVKTLVVPGVVSSDFEVMDYHPSPDDMHNFATYYQGRPVPVGGGYLEVAYSPFGQTTLVLLNGDEVKIYGNGKVPISYEQGGLDYYKDVPRIPELLSHGYFKILKLALYTRYDRFQHRKYSLNLFSPTMEIFKEPIQGQVPKSDSKVKAYINSNFVTENGDLFLEDTRDPSLRFPAKATKGNTSVLYGVGRMVSVAPDGFIDLSTLGPNLGDEFSIHINFTVDEFANRGTVIFEMGYGVTDVGFQTHHITLWVTDEGLLKYNCQYSDEHISTGATIKEGVEYAVTFTVENQKFDEQDDDEYVTFIHLNGQQIFPEKEMLTPTEKIYLWRAKEAYRVLTEVCVNLPSPHPVSGGLDPKKICAQKLLQESGFITVERLKDIYAMYLKRPRANKADLEDIKLNSEENKTIKKFFVCQDSEKDTFDSEYYFKGQTSEIAVFSPSLNREEIEEIHLLNITKTPSVNLE